MFRKINKILEGYKYFIFIYTIILEVLSYGMEEDTEIRLIEDTLSVVCSIYRELEDCDDYLQRLIILRNQAVNFPDADKVRKQAEESMLELLKIQQHNQLDLLYAIKFREFEENWLNFYQENREQYLVKLDTHGVNTDLVSDHKTDMENLQNAKGLDFFERLAQKWRDVDKTRKIYQQAYRR